MFHEGTLQDGIGKALQESKSVLCFVTDESDESNKWENEWLQDQNIPNAVERHAVALRIKAGSEEAGFLSAFCPMNETPTVVVIHQGQLRDQLNNGTTKNDFTIRLLQAIRPQVSPPQHQVSSSTPNPSSAATPSASTTTSTSRLQPTSSNDTSTTSNSQSSPQPSEPLDPRSNPRYLKDLDKASEDQARRKREAKEERLRILKQIENDKIERRRREEERKQAARLQANELSEPSDPPGSNPVKITTPQTQQPGSKQHASASIQVRLPEGGTSSIIRQTFPSTAPISDVRKWINEQTGELNAYSLRLVLTPAPSSIVSTSDDKGTATLAELNLAPSATLILVPPKSKSSYSLPGAGGMALPGAPDGVRGVASTVWMYLMLLIKAIANIFSFVIDKIKIFLGVGDAVPRSAQQQARELPRGGDQSEAAPSSARATGSSVASKPASQGNAGNIRIRTLRDQRDEEDKDSNNFYNGNRLSFEPNVNDQNDEDGQPD